MKYLAILNDSLREAIDTKVFYVMVALSAIVMLVVGSVSFRPRPAAELAEMFTTVPLNVDPAALEKAFLTGLPPAQRSAGLYIQVKVEPLDGAPDNPSSPLVFTVRAMYLQKEEAAKVKAAPAGTKEFIKENFASIGQWKILEVTRVDLAETQSPGNLDFQVWTRPTPSTLRVWPHEPVLFF